MKKLAPILQNPELIGVACGLAILALFPLSENLLIQPNWALLSFVLLASVAGFAAAGRASHLSFPPERCVRRGTWSGLFACMAAAACLILMAKLQSPVRAPLRAMLIAATSLMPALLVGMLAAGGGALVYRQTALNIQGDPVPPPDLPKRTRIFIRAGILLFLMGAFLSPLVPAKTSVPPPPVRWVPVPNPVSEPKVTAPSFVYTPPTDLGTASPAGWTIAQKRELGEVRADRGLALSSTGRYLGALEPDGSLIVYDLESEGVKRISPLLFPILQVAISPDDNRVFVVLEATPRKVGVVDLDSRESILLPQPKKYAVPEGRISWWKPQEVVFLPDKGRPMVLNLETLEFDPGTLSKEELDQIRAGLAVDFPESDKWSVYRTESLMAAPLPEEEGNPQWRWETSSRLVVQDLQYATRQIFPSVDTENCEALFGTMDGSKVLRIRNGSLTVIYMGTGTVPPLRWQIAMPHGPEQMPEKDLVRLAMARRELGLVMYSPLVNPLSNKIIGPDRAHPKAILRVLRWEGTEAEVWVETGITSYAPNDILADLHVAGSPLRLLSADLPHRWWVMAPAPIADAADPGRLPLRKDLVQEPTEKESAKFDQTVKAQVEPRLPAPSMEFDDIRKSVTTFVLAHHAAASEGRLETVVGDYAELVDHFNNGIVGRDFIRKDESEYHRKYRYVRERIQGDPVMRETGTGRVEVSYLMANEWQRLADNVSGGAVFRVTLTLEDQPGGWKIIRHRAEKQN